MSSTQQKAFDIQYKGRRFYHAGNYTAAIAAFTRALELHNVPSTEQIGILDDRAAAREKIGGAVNLELALQDARMMIQMSGADASGYFRAGGILELLNQDKSALGIYADGIKRLKPDSLQFETLNEKFKEVQDRIALRELRDTRRDPVKFLPVEIVEPILQYLPFGDLMIAQRVSRAWRSFIHTSHKTYTCLDFSAARRDVSESSLRAYISRSGGGVREAVLSGFSDYSALSTLVHQCPQLSILRIRPNRIASDVLLEDIRIASNLTVLITDHRFSTNEFYGILESHVSLRTLECGGIICSLRPSPIKAFTANLRRLKIRGRVAAIQPQFTETFISFPSPERILQDLIKFLPKLEEVEIMDSPSDCTFLNSAVDFRSLESLSVLVLKWSYTKAFPLLPASVRVLDVSGRSNIRWSLQGLAASPLPNLEIFRAEYSPQIENAHVLAILAPSLEKRSFRSLSLRMCRNVDFSSLEWLMEHGENLEELAIGWNNTLTEEGLKEVAKFKKLRYLDLSYSGISSTGLVNVINGSQGELREVDISRCYIGKDAVQLAAKSGVKLTKRNMCFW